MAKGKICSVCASENNVQALRIKEILTLIAGLIQVEPYVKKLAATKLICKDCQKKLTSPPTAEERKPQQQQQQATGAVRVRGLRCSECDTTFRSVDCFERHTRVCRMPLGFVQPYKCSECSFNSRLASQMKRHRRHIHADLNPLVYECRVCGRLFKTFREAKVHRQLHKA